MHDERPDRRRAPCVASTTAAHGLGTARSQTRSMRRSSDGCSRSATPWCRGSSAGWLGRGPLGYAPFSDCAARHGDRATRRQPGAYGGRVVAQARRGGCSRRSGRHRGCCWTPDRLRTIAIDASRSRRDRPRNRRQTGWRSKVSLDVAQCRCSWFPAALREVGWAALHPVVFCALEQRRLNIKIAALDREGHGLNVHAHRHVLQPFQRTVVFL